MNPSLAIKAEARALGFDLCGITTADPPTHREAFRRWLADGCHGEMHYLARDVQRRLSPAEVLPGAKSVVVVAMNYHLPEPSPSPPVGPPGFVARFARGEDYHQVLGRRLERLSAAIRRLDPSARTRWYVDTGPLLERDLAQRAGLGWIGKHTNLIHRRLGNWLLLGQILTTSELPPDPPEREHCGTCTRCLLACPTGAIRAPYRLDARRCISYLTIELKGSIPLDLRPLIGNRIFGCDDCLAACPWNRFARSASELRLDRIALRQPDLIEWLALDETQFRTRFRGTPLERIKRRGLLRNVAVALGNSGDRAALPALQRACADADPLVREHAAWAVQRLLP